mgnify:CR=1 FL=1
MVMIWYDENGRHSYGGMEIFREDRKQKLKGGEIKMDKDYSEKIIKPENLESGMKVTVHSRNNGTDRSFRGSVLEVVSIDLPYVKVLVWKWRVHSRSPYWVLDVRETNLMPISEDMAI